tara:strand:- start:40096 stop:40350 length:255 start_codon:yes stop_codon:yes gene_type:complete
MDSSFIQARITSTKALIIAYETATLALVGGGIQSYTIDTGQNRNTVTKLDLDTIQKTIDSLYNQCATLEARLNGSGTSIARGAW